MLLSEVIMPDMDGYQLAFIAWQLLFFYLFDGVLACNDQTVSCSSITKGILETGY